MRTRPPSILNRITVLAVCSALVAAALIVTPARAAAIVVTTASDVVNPGDGLCTLREAITAANTNTASGPGAGECAAGSGADTISFLGNYTITLAPGLGQLPIVTSPITINGKGTAKTVIRAHAASNTAVTRVFYVDFAGSLTLNALSVRNGRCNGSCTIVTDSGGGIYNSGTLAVKNSAVSGNAAKGLGGGIYNSGTLTVTHSTFSGNTANVGGSGISNSGTLTVTRSTFSGNTTPGGGGGISNSGTLNVTNSTFSGNSADVAGGGLYQPGSSATANLTNSTFSGNSAGSFGGGILNSGTLDVKNSTLSGNSSPNGGGIYNGHILTVTNSTFFANSAPSGFGGGIGNGGTLTVRNSTLSANSASNGGGLHTQVGAANLYNSIVANSPGGLDCLHGGTGTFTADSSNLDSDGSCDNAAQRTTVEIKLQPLAANGGPTKTMALLSGSAAIDTGTDAGCPATDQRGKPRPQGTHCDIGAYEAPTVTPFRSGGPQDGFVLETGENSNLGGPLNATALTFNLGDNATDRQYRAILHFNTASLPDNAVITRVVLKIRKQGLTGTDPFTTHMKIAVDVRKGAFGGNAALQPADFQAPAHKGGAGLIANNPQAGGWYSTRLNSAAYPFINLTGVTQFRLRFQKDDNDDLGADFLKFFSGNAVAASRPVLVVEYYVP